MNTKLEYIYQLDNYERVPISYFSPEEHRDRCVFYGATD